MKMHAPASRKSQVGGIALEDIRRMGIADIIRRPCCSIALINVQEFSRIVGGLVMHGSNSFR